MSFIQFIKFKKAYKIDTPNYDYKTYNILRIGML